MKILEHGKGSIRFDADNFDEAVTIMNLKRCLTMGNEVIISVTDNPNVRLTFNEKATKDNIVVAKGDIK